MTNIMIRRPLTTRWKLAGLAWASVASVGAPSPVAAQALDLDFAVEQAITSVDDMGSPTGYRVGIFVPAAMGPVGLEVGYRSVSEYLGERPARCGMDVCEPGPFDVVMRMRTATFGIGVSRMLNPFVEFTAGGTIALTWQDTERGPVDGSPSEDAAFGTDRVGPDPGFGAFASWRFPPLLSVLRPFLYVRAEWIRSGPCAADASCFGTRYLGSGGIGMYARIP